MRTEHEEGIGWYGGLRENTFECVVVGDDIDRNMADVCVEQSQAKDSASFDELIKTQHGSNGSVFYGTALEPEVPYLMECRWGFPSSALPEPTSIRRSYLTGGRGGVVGTVSHLQQTSRK